MPSLTCILHHHIGPETAFEAGLNVASSRAAYEAQIDWLRRSYNVVSLDDVLSGSLPDRPLLMTFDDAFRSVLDVARDLLAPAGLPAVFFVNPALLHEGAISLDSALAWAVGTVGLPKVCAALDLPPRETLGQVLLGDLSLRGATAREAAKGRLLDAFGPPDLSQRAPLLDAADLAELTALGVEIGNHTATHVSCRSLSAEERQTEIVASKARLEALSGARVRALSIPYGWEQDLTEDVLDCARQSGHEAIFLVHARANWRRPAPDIWYRVSLHDETPRQLPSTLKLKPALRALRHMARPR